MTPRAVELKNVSAVAQFCDVVKDQHVSIEDQDRFFNKHASTPATHADDAERVS
ncbi:MAG: hypothetical protein JXQ99_21185 [Hyphomicrobiaceae bacterium]